MKGFRVAPTQHFSISKGNFQLALDCGRKICYFSNFFFNFPTTFSELSTSYCSGYQNPNRVDEKKRNIKEIVKDTVKDALKGKIFHEKNMIFLRASNNKFFSGTYSLSSLSELIHFFWFHEPPKSKVRSLQHYLSGWL